MIAIEPWMVKSALLALHNIAEAIGMLTKALVFMFMLWAIFSSNHRKVTIEKGGL